MKDEKFKVIDFIRKLIIRIDTELANFPKKEIEIKNRIRTNTYDILELAYLANEKISIDLDDGVKMNYAKFQGVEVAQEGKKALKIDFADKDISRRFCCR